MKYASLTISNQGARSKASQFEQSKLRVDAF